MKNFQGAYTALITPFTEDDQLDEEGLRVLIHRQLQANIDGIVILGSTGETPTLEEKEKKRIIAIAREDCAQKTSLIIGTGCNSTKQTIDNTKAAENAGADAALVVVPYYNRPTQEGIYQHFNMISEESSLPIMLYNVPGRCGQNLHVDTLKRLLDIPSIIGIKEASGDISQINDMIHLVKQTRPNFSVLSGDDALTLPVMALGGGGIVSVISNVFPVEVKNLVEAIVSGDFALAKTIHHDLMPMVKLAFLETNPIPIKAMHGLYDLPGGKCRLPLSELSSENALRMQRELRKDRCLSIFGSM